MAVEQITSSQAKNAQLVQIESDDSLAKKIAFIADDAARKTKQAADLASEAAANAPDLVMVGLQQSIEAMLTMINGYQNAKNPTFDPMPLITKITASLNTVIVQLQGLQIPAIPGLAIIKGLLVKLETISAATKTVESQTGSKPGYNPEISPELMNTVQDLLVATQSLCCVIPLAILKLVFDMFNNVIQCFKQIMPHNYGLPTIPSPLATAPLCSAAMPNFIDFVTNFSGQLGTVTYGTFRKQAKILQDAQIPAQPIDVLPITNGAAIPTRDSK